jgi:multiple sugar transport system permease protein
VSPRTSVRSGRRSRRPGWAGYGFVSFYAVLLFFFGVGPALYAVYLAFTNADGQFVGLGQFVKVATDYRFLESFGNIAGYVVIWLLTLLVLTVGLALILHQRSRFVSSTLRFLFYLPGALAGVAGVLVWLFMLDPTTSPFSSLLKIFGMASFQMVILPNNLPVLFVIIAFWIGAGGWIVVMYGALNNIPNEVLDASKVDGANGFQLAWYIQIPMIRKWIVYMAILAFAGGTQLFVEPQLLGTSISPTWSPNELNYVFAFGNNDFNGAAALSLYLLLICAVGAFLLISRSGLFKVDDE